MFFENGKLVDKEVPLSFDIHLKTLENKDNLVLIGVDLSFAEGTQPKFKHQVRASIMTEALFNCMCPQEKIKNF